MKKIIFNVPMRVPDAKGTITKKQPGNVIEKPDKVQLAFAEANPNCCAVIEIKPEKPVKKAPVEEK